MWNANDHVKSSSWLFSLCVSQVIDLYSVIHLKLGHETKSASGRQRSLFPHHSGPGEICGCQKHFKHVSFFSHVSYRLELGK